MKQDRDVLYILIMCDMLYTLKYLPKTRDE